MNTFYGIVNDPQYKSTKIPCVDVSCVSTVKRLVFQAVKLCSKKEGMPLCKSLFTKHTSFSDASSIVLTKLCDRNDECTLLNFGRYDDTVETIFKMFVPILASVVKSRGAGSALECSDVSTLSTILQIMQNQTGPSSDHYVYEEISLESKTSKKLLGGNFDILIAETSNERPKFILDDGSRQSVSTLYCVALAEAKSPSTPIAGSNSDNLASFSQPVIELTAMASACDFPNNSVPLVQFYGNRHRYRPIMYFKASDIIITTSNPIQYLNSEGEICLEGLFLMFLLCYKYALQFDVESIERLFPKSGWGEATRLYNPYAGLTLKRQSRSGIVEPPQNLMTPILISPTSLLSVAMKRTSEEGQSS